jgi:hypothetical protein
MTAIHALLAAATSSIVLSFEVPTRSQSACPSDRQQHSPLAHVMQLANALTQLLFALLWLPVTEHNFF